MSLHVYSALPGAEERAEKPFWWELFEKNEKEIIFHKTYKNEALNAFSALYSMRTFQKHPLPGEQKENKNIG
ncbi:MAG: hypothetical protein AAF603_02905 [Pseudomonadota bacterium]